VLHGIGRVVVSFRRLSPVVKHRLSQYPTFFLLFSMSSFFCYESNKKRPQIPDFPNIRIFVNAYSGFERTKQMSTKIMC